MEDTAKRTWIDSLSHRVKQVLFWLLVYASLLLICFLAISPEQYDLSVGDVSPQTITASRDIIDEITTERRRQAASGYGCGIFSAARRARTGPADPWNLDGCQCILQR